MLSKVLILLVEKSDSVKKYLTGLIRSLTKNFEETCVNHLPSFSVILGKMNKM